MTAHTPEQIEKIVDNILGKLDRAAFNACAVNWGNLRCVEARRFENGQWYILVEDAATDEWRLQKAVRDSLLARGIEAVVHTEW